MPKLSDLTDFARRRSGAVFLEPGADISGVDELDLIGVTLVARTADGPVEVPDLALFFDKVGMTVRRSDRSRVATIPWQDLVEATAEPEPGAEVGAATLVDLEVASGRRRHFFRVPVAEPLALGRSLDLLSTRYRDRPLMAEPKPTKRPWRG